MRDDLAYFAAGGLISAWLILLLTGFAAGGAVHLLLAAGIAIFVRERRRA